MNSSERSPLKLIELPHHRERIARTTIHIPLSKKPFAPGIPAAIGNLSTTGAFIETIPERQGRIIDIAFGFPGESISFRVTSKIAWCRRKNESQYQLGKPIGMGVTFIRFMQGQPEELQNLLQQWQSSAMVGPRDDHMHLVKTKPRADFQTIQNETHPQVLNIKNLPEDFHDWEIEKALEFLSPE